MNGTIKFIIGGVATSLMAMAAHSWIGLGGGFIDRLEVSARTALGEAGGGTMTLAMLRDPALQRVAILSGDADAATRARLLAAVRAVPGMADARWADNAAATAAAAPAEAPATVQQVEACQAQVDRAIAGQTIQFESGSAYIKPQSQGLIDSLAAVLAPCAGVVIEVAGHTDASGNAAVNQRLSQARAAAVVAALVAKSVPADRLAARGYGSSVPQQAGRGAAADAANRRIEFKVASNPAVAPASVETPINAAAPAAAQGGQ